MWAISGSNLGQISPIIQNMDPTFAGRMPVIGSGSVVQKTEKEMVHISLFDFLRRVYCVIPNQMDN